MMPQNVVMRIVNAPSHLDSPLKRSRLLRTEVTLGNSATAFEHIVSECEGVGYISVIGTIMHAMIDQLIAAMKAEDDWNKQESELRSHLQTYGVEALEAMLEDNYIRKGR